MESWTSKAFFIYLAHLSSFGFSLLFNCFPKLNIAPFNIRWRAHSIRFNFTCVDFYLLIGLNHKIYFEQSMKLEDCKLISFLVIATSSFGSVVIKFSFTLNSSSTLIFHQIEWLVHNWNPRTVRRQSHWLLQVDYILTVEIYLSTYNLPYACSLKYFTSTFSFNRRGLFSTSLMFSC